MYKRSSKQQVVFSLRQLSAGLFYHLENKPLDDISVTDICKRAGLSRRTFYRNCEEKEDLIRFSTEVLVREQLSQVDFTSVDAHSLYSDFFLYWDKHRDFLRILYSSCLFDLFLREFVRISCDDMRYPLQEKTLEGCADKNQKRRFSNAFIIGGLGQMLAMWTEEGFKTSPEEMAESIVFLAPAFL